MTTLKTWLLAGAALTLCAGASLAYAAETTGLDAIREAQQDAAKGGRDGDGKVEKRTERREVRVYRNDDGDRRDVRIYRGDHGGDVTIIHGGGREESLSAILQLRADQQAALKAFLDTTRSEHGHEQMAKIDREAEGRTTLQRLDEMKAKLDQQQAEANRKIAAIKTFYAQLDDKQRKAFDAMPMLMMVGPSIGPMMIPRPMPIVYRTPPAPPIPPVPPVPPREPRAPRS